MKPTKLIAHPEGGRYQRVFKSNAVVTTHHGHRRSALTHIYFSLEPGEVSFFHRVCSDEVWNLYRGTGLFLYTWDGCELAPQKYELSAASESFCHAVPAGVWQAAEPMEDGVLVGCSVGPGFEFEDFELINPMSRVAKTIQSMDARLARFIEA